MKITPPNTHTRQGVRNLNNLQGTNRVKPTCPPHVPGKKSFSSVKGDFGLTDTITTTYCILCGAVIDRHREPYVW